MLPVVLHVGPKMLPVVQAAVRVVLEVGLRLRVPVLLEVILEAAPKAIQ